jgi:RHS repeat-associated protein
MIAVSGGTETIYYYHFDGLGSVVALSDMNSVIVEQYSYNVVGKPNTTNNVNNPYLFTARKYNPEEAGLYYHRARYYPHDIGRFLQPDPINYDDGMNVYAYAGNNPINWGDPMGLCKGGFSKWDRFKIGALEKVAGSAGWIYDNLWGEEISTGKFVGTSFGESAQDYWADKYVQSTGFKKFSTGTLLAFSSLWKEET